MKQIPSSQFTSLFVDSPHWIDVRAPVEFAAGHVSGAVNLPLLNDEERHQIGITYKEKGQDAAIELGHALVRGQIRAERTDLWINESRRFPNAMIYCFRGGLRSHITQSWLNEKSCELPLIEGGYKALRRFLTEQTELLSAKLKFEVVCGPTGSGKTAYLHQSGRPFIDLEALAAHRGSAFGASEIPQPAQATFENALAIQLIRLAEENEPILIEDESRQIGQRGIPLVVFQRMIASPKLILKVPIEQRTENILKDYVLNSKLGIHGDLQRFAEFRAAVRAISRRLGADRTSEVLKDIDFSEVEYRQAQSFESNRIWIAKLLKWYYDPYYEYSLKRNDSERVQS